MKNPGPYTSLPNTLFGLEKIFSVRVSEGSKIIKTLERMSRIIKECQDLPTELVPITDSSDVENVIGIINIENKQFYIYHVLEKQ